MASPCTVKPSQKKATRPDIASEAGRRDAPGLERDGATGGLAILSGLVNAAASAARALHSDDKVSPNT